MKHQKLFVLLALFSVACAKENLTENYEKYPYSKATMAERIDSYLNGSFACNVDEVEVGENNVTVSGTCPLDGEYYLVEIAPNEDVTEYSRYEHLDKVEGKFVKTYDRHIQKRMVEYDRILSKWAIVASESEADRLVSAARYADKVPQLRQASKVDFRSKKGLGAGGGSSYFADIAELGATSITKNIDLSKILSTKNSTGAGMPFVYNGIEYYINTETTGQLDNFLKSASDLNLVVMAIILIPTSSELKDPECDGGYYAMPNMSSARAVNNYAAAMDYLAERYSQDGMRIHHWILQNEIDDNVEWTNMGTQPVARYVDRYVKSMRLCYNVIRQYDQNASVLVSLAHSWAQPLDGYLTEYASYHILERIVKYSNLEGDFKWGVAYHPYPAKLSEPRFWTTDALDYTKATYKDNSPYVTFKNPEVINKWITDSKNYYMGTEKRLLVFSEQGSNSPSYEARDLGNQAAGAAWFWKKCAKLDGIDAVQWHAWCDNKQEFGLKIGLRDYDFNKKPVFSLWAAAGTENEDKVFSKYLSYIGVKSWDDIFYGEGSDTPGEEEPEIVTVEAQNFALSGTASPIGSETIADWMAFNVARIGESQTFEYKGWLNAGNLFAFANNTGTADYAFCPSTDGETVSKSGFSSKLAVIQDGGANPSSYAKWNVQDSGYWHIVFDAAGQSITAEYLGGLPSAGSAFPVEGLYMNIKFNDSADFGIRKDQMIQMEEVESGVYRAQVSVPSEKSYGQVRFQFDFGGHTLPVIRPSASGKTTIAESDGGMDKTEFAFDLQKPSGAGADYFWLHSDTPGHSYYITVDLNDWTIRANLPPVESSAVRLSGPGVAEAGGWGKYVNMEATEDPYIFSLDCTFVSGGSNMFTVYLDSDARSLIPFKGSNQNIVIGANKFKYLDGAASHGWFVSQVPGGLYNVTVNLRDYTLTVSSK